MARFKQHEPCPRCGSRDNLGRYDDGGAFCYGCHYSERATHAPMRHMGSTNEHSEKYHHAIPEDAGTNFRADAVEWLASFHVDVPTAIRNGLVWSERSEQLIYKLGNCWQARNFNEERKRKSKNFTSGDVNECLFIYSHNVLDICEQTDQERQVRESRRLAVVEDPISALRIGPWCDSIPLLGSHLATARMIVLAGLYDSFVFWLDSDKLKEARGMADRAKLMGLSTNVIWTELDPKCYTDAKLKEILNV